MRQAKLVASFRVKVPDGGDHGLESVRFNQPPISSVAHPAERCSGHDCGKREQRRMSEAYTENHIDHRGFAHSRSHVSIVSKIKAVGDVFNVTEANTKRSKW